MDSVNQARSQAWSLWTKLAAPALLWSPVLGISAVLVVSTPLAAVARTLPRAQEMVSAEPTHRQMHVLRSYERYLARMKAQSHKATRAVRFAYRQVGKPYQWGGAGPRTYDCSGLVMAAWRKGGLRLPHRADLQHRTIRRKVGLKHLRPGDLVFFSGDHHVGIYVGKRHFLHAPHTGSRVQRGTLSGWRLRSFAGAARPAAPAYHAWPHWVRTLADHTDEHGRPKRHRPHGHAQAAFPDTTGPDTTGPDTTGPDTTGPDTTGPDDASMVEPITPEFEDGGQAPGLDTAPPTMTPPTPAAEPDRPPAYAPSQEVGILPIPALTMSAPSRKRHHAVRADVTPVPRPQDHNGPAPRPHSPGTTVQQQNDEQKFDRVFDGRGDADDDDSDLGNDGIDLRSLLGGAP
jgi:cell wall-associated NlpC family hydrolase